MSRPIPLMSEALGADDLDEPLPQPPHLRGATWLCAHAVADGRPRRPHGSGWGSTPAPLTLAGMSPWSSSLSALAAAALPKVPMR